MSILTYKIHFLNSKLKTFQKWDVKRFIFNSPLVLRFVYFIDLLQHDIFFKENSNKIFLREKYRTQIESKNSAQLYLLIICRICTANYPQNGSKTLRLYLPTLPICYLFYQFNVKLVYLKAFLKTDPIVMTFTSEKLLGENLL